jgi:hypothetical protein
VKEKGVNGPVSVKFTSFSVKIYVLRNTKNLAGLQIRVDDTFDKILGGGGLILNVRDAEKSTLREFWKKDKLLVEGRNCDLGNVVKNIQLGV